MFGIHIGNTNSSIAACKNNGYVDIVVDEGGDRVISSFVTFTDEETISGNIAKSALVSKSTTTVTHNKCLLNFKTNDIDLFNHHNIALELKDNEIHYRIPLTEKSKLIAPETVASIILRKLFNTANNNMNLKEETLSCVLLVPQSFAEETCEKYRSAAESAGWKVLQVINECAAAILAYSLLHDKEPSQVILVYRLGGTTCEVAVFELSEGMLYALGSEYRTDIGGNEFTEILAEHFATEFFKKYKMDIKGNKRSWEKLKLGAEKCVHNLTVGQTAQCFIESLHEGVDFSMPISRCRFELLIQPAVLKFLAPIKYLLNQLDFDDNVDKIVLCGGGTIVPKLRESIATMFDINVTQILAHINAGEVLALGAARQAYYLAENNVHEFVPRVLQIPLEEDEQSCNLEDV